MKNKKLLTGCAIGSLLLLVIAFLIIWGVGVYNILINSNEAIKKQWLQLTNQFDKRIDVLPGFISFSSEIQLEESDLSSLIQKKVIGLNQLSAGPDILDDEPNFKTYTDLQSQLTNLISQLLLRFENHPELKANENFLQLNASLDRIENAISVDQKKYNEIVQDYNSKIKSFPFSLIAGIFNFNEKPYLR